MKNVFSIHRLGILVRKDILFDWRSSVLAAAVVSGVLILAATLGSVIGENEIFGYGGYFRATLSIWGIIAASMTFSELHDKSKSDQFLLLPASAAEKTLVRLLRVSLFLPLFILIVIILSSLLIESVLFLIVSKPFYLFNPFTGDLWRAIGQMVIVQSLFFLGAAWFKKTHLLKTLFSILAFCIGLGILSAIFMRIFWGSSFEMHIGAEWLEGTSGLSGFYRWRSLAEGVLVFVKVFFYGLLAPLCWVVAWLRVKETQSSDGV